MKLNTTRKTKTYKAGDEVTVQITECKENNNGNINMKLYIVDGNALSSVFFYQTIGVSEKSSFILDQFFNAVGVPEGLDIDLDYFKGKRFNCILGESEWSGKTNLTVAKFIAATLDTEIDPIPYISNDVPFMDAKPAKPVDSTPSKGKKNKSKNPDSPVRIDYTQLFDESVGESETGQTE